MTTYRKNVSRNIVEQEYGEKDFRFDTSVLDLLGRLIDHVKDMEGFYKKSNQHHARRACSALRSDLGAVVDCFTEVRRVARLKYVEQLSFPFYDDDTVGVARRASSPRGRSKRPAA